MCAPNVDQNETPIRVKVKDPLEYFLLEELQENLMIGSAAIDARLRDIYNESLLSTLRYSFVPGIDERQHLFEIDEQTSIIKTAQVIDRDGLCPGSNACYVLLHVRVYPEYLNKTIRILVEILDINDHAPTFPEKYINLNIPESAPIGTQFILPPATDIDSGVNAIQRYELMSNTNRFELNTIIKEDAPTELRLTLKEKLDRETTGFYQLKVVAYDGSSEPKSGSILVNVTVEDIDDHDPVFTDATYEAFIEENLPGGSRVFQVTALDRDLGVNAKIKYGFSAKTQEAYGHIFGIMETDGQIYLKDSLDFEYGSTYLLVVTASDQGGEKAHPGHATVIVRVRGSNDHPPILTLNTLTNSGMAEVLEGADRGTFVARINVADQDGGENGMVECSLTHEKFALEMLHQSEYRIITRSQLDREIKAFYDVTVVCRDLGSHPNVALQEVHVKVLDINDESPKFDQLSYNTHIKENNEIDDELIQISASDMDQGENAEIRYSLAPDAKNLFTINPQTGVILVNTILDHEMQREILFHAVATDLGEPPMSSSALISVSILDTGEETPLFAQHRYEFGIFENKPGGNDVGVVKLSEHHSRGYSQFHFPTEDNDDAQFFEIDRSSGKITTKISLDREGKSVYYTKVVATKHGLHEQTGTVSVTIYIADQNDCPPIITFPSAKNNSLQISGSIPRGHEIVQIKATDRDLGDNAKLSYYIAGGNRDGIFALNPASGVLLAAKNFEAISKTNFRLAIVVQDNGYPRLNDEQFLNIYINHSLMFTSAESKHEVLSSRHATIVVAVVASVLVFIFVVLFTFMLVLLWKRAKNEPKKSSHNSDSCNYSTVTSSRTLSSCFDTGSDGREERDERDRGVAEGQEEDRRHNGNASIPTRRQPPVRNCDVALRVDNEINDLHAEKLHNTSYLGPQKNMAKVSTCIPSFITLVRFDIITALCKLVYI